jgi:signal transduction histidine kinase
MAVDVLATAALALFAAFRTSGHAVLVWSLLAVVVLPLVVRRRRPMPVFVVVLAAGAAAIMVGAAGDAVVIALALALYPVGLSETSRSGVLALVAALSAVSAAGLATIVVPGLPLIAAPEGEESFATAPVTALLYSALIITGSWVLARAARARRDHAAQLADLRARQAVADERLRIARDIHDVVGHSLSLIAMKAAVANHLVNSRPEEGWSALSTIEHVSREALDDVRTVLDALRDTADTTAGVAEIDRLVADVRAVGVTVEVDRADLTDVPAAVQASAYRIVQEALTNVLRHAGPTRCQLTLADEVGILTISVVNERTKHRATGRPGHGLLGMRERVAMHGGTLDFGPEPGGGFGVRARLPYASAVRDE